MSHGLDGVLDEIHQCLFHLHFVQRRVGQLLGEVLRQRDLTVFNFRPEQSQGIEQNIVKRNGLELRTRRTDGLQKLADDVVQPIDFTLGDLEIGFQLANTGGVVGGGIGIGKVQRRVGVGGLQLFHLTFHQLQMNVQGVERVTDFMRHTGSQ